VAELTPKQRVKMAVSHIQPDRPPIQTYLTPEIHAKLVEHFKDVPIHEAFEIDFRYVGPAGGPTLKTPESGAGSSITIFSVPATPAWRTHPAGVSGSHGPCPGANHDHGPGRVLSLAQPGCI